MAAKFDSEFVERRMREHREWQEQEADRLSNEAMKEITDFYEAKAILPRPKMFKQGGISNGV